MRLDRYLRPDLVLSGLDAHGTEEVLRRIGRHLADRGVVDSAEEVERKLLDREGTHSTAMGQGMALPHATIDGLEEPVLMVALASEPVPFGSPETGPVQVFFVLLSPPGHEGEHIKLLARICRLVRHPGFVEELHEAESGQAVVDVIERVDGQHV